MLKSNQPDRIALHCSVMHELLAALSNVIGSSERIRRKKKNERSVLFSGRQCMTEGRHNTEGVPVGDGRHNTEGVPVGDGQHISPAEFLLMAGFLVYRAPLAPNAARAAARRILDTVFGVAAASGFAHSDALEMMMANAEKSSRIWTLAEQATAAVGDTTAFLQVIRGAGVSLEGDL
jgi:hypothetical protein